MLGDTVVISSQLKIMEWKKQAQQWRNLFCNQWPSGSSKCKTMFINKINFSEVHCIFYFSLFQFMTSTIFIPSAELIKYTKIKA